MNVFEEKTINNKLLPLEWQDNSSLLDFESFLQLNWEQRHTFFEDNDYHSQQQFIEFKNRGSIRTKNYVGTVSFKGKQINIFPKVFAYELGDDDTTSLDTSHLMLNLIKWIEYCNKVDYPYISMQTDVDSCEDLKELFITLFIKYLNSAFKRNRYNQYIEKNEDIHIIKGKFDSIDYYLNKIAKGKIDMFNCTYSEFQFDNLLNQIIKATCKMLLGYNTSKKNKFELRNLIQKMAEVSDVRCLPKDCDKVILGKMHKHYKIILSMCKIFLSNKVSSYNFDNNESFCFLFPTEYLFEGFISGFIKEVLQECAIVKCQASDKTVFEDIEFAGESLGKTLQMRHDILIEHKEKGLFVLDTKYKGLPRFEDSEDMRAIISREVSTPDIYQMITYAWKRNLHDVYLLYPLYRDEDDEPNFPIGKSVAEDGKIINVHFLRIPFVFEKNCNIKDRLKKIIESILV